jgi:Zn-dependent M28 family amino/carboxypeptidase
MKFSWEPVSCRGRVVFVLLLLMSAMAVSAGPVEEKRQKVEELQALALQDDLAWELLWSLTTHVGPRMAGSPGDALAVAWAQEQMQHLEFDRVWLEPVEFPRWLRRAERAAMTAPRQQGLAVTALGGSPATNGVISAPVVHFADLAALEAADPQALAGKIAFISARMEASQSGEAYGEVVSGRSKGPYVAARKGAAALVIRSVGSDSNRLPHTGNISGTEEGQAVPSAAISSPDADLLAALIQKGETVVLELELDVGFDGMATSYNVVGEFDGRESGSGFVFVGGHLDSWDLGTGAHDDGAGVAITMAAARRVADLSPRPRRGTRVVLFANEEQGVFGGKAYAVTHAGELDSHVLGAESDLGGDRIYQFRTRVDESAEPAMDELAALLAPLGIPRETDELAGGGADIGQMRKLGMPVVDLNHDATRYFDYHHTANDTLDKVDPDDLRFNVAAYVTFIYFAAESEVIFGPVDGEAE